MKETVQSAATSRKFVSPEGGNMGNKIVVYYSNTGNNRYLAERTAEALGSEIVTIKPRVAPHLLLLLASATKISPGNRKMEKDFGTYESVILCGPIWMGQVVAPLSDFLKKYGNQIKKLHFITCCGSKDSTKDDRFGYAHVFRKIRNIAGDRSGEFRAFPVELSLPEEKRNNDQAMMEARLNDESFKGELEKRLGDFISAIK